MPPKIPEEAKNKAVSEELLNLMPLELVKEFRAFVFEKTDKGVKLAAVNPKDKSLMQYAKDRFGKNIEWFLADNADVRHVINCCERNFKEEIQKLAETARETNNNIVRIVNEIIEYAITEKASDIHVEPQRSETIVRFRIDGLLHAVLNLPKTLHPSLVARFKIIANLKLDEYKRPQDGRIEPEEFPMVSLRTSVMPTLFGEKIVLRVLDESSKSISIDELGFSKLHKDIILKNMEKPFGMIIASGPTGSGKTTTLYALLQLLKKDGINISTLEDPIEYALSGVNQVQINPQFDLTFASGLRALLRQDPNVIMIGEIRDSETAVMAANAAMTGHLVLTTLHTNDAASAFTRLLEMKVEDFVVAGTVNLVIAQRLVRKICPHCAKEQIIDKVVAVKIKERRDVMEALEEMEEGLSKNIENRKFFAGKGCKNCYNTGYLGRVGLYEILSPNKDIQDAILRRQSSSNIESIAEKYGFKNMVSDGIDKIFDGKTTFEEVLRTTKNT